MRRANKYHDDIPKKRKRVRLPNSEYLTKGGKATRVNASLDRLFGPQMRQKYDPNFTR